MNDLGDVISWPIRDSDWVPKILLMSLVTVIPILGEIVLYGWMLACLTNLRQDRRELPRAGFGYAGRGWPLFVVVLVYRVLIVIVAGILFAIGAVIATGGANSAAGVVGAALGFLLSGAVVLAGLLGLLFIMPAVMLETDRGGIAAGLNLSRVAGLVTRRPEAALMAALSLLIGYFIGSLGSFVCIFGIFLTIAYGAAVAAGAIRRYEIELGAPTRPPAVPAAQ